MISVAYAAAEGAQAVSPLANPGFWVGAAFFLVIALAFKPVMRSMGAGLDARAEKIKARIEEAERLREEAQEMLASYKRKQAEAMKDAEDIIASAKAEAERLSAQAAKDLDEQLKRREAQALDRITQAENAALREVKDLAVDVAINAARTVLAQSVSAQQAGALVDQAISDLPKKLH